MSENSVEVTNGIPICPNCNIPTVREKGYTTVTAMYFPPVYDENGKDISVDKNVRTEIYKCQSCKKEFGIKGNNHQGYKYI